MCILMILIIEYHLEKLIKPLNNSKNHFLLIFKTKYEVLSSVKVVNRWYV